MSVWKKFRNARYAFVPNLSFGFGSMTIFGSTCLSKTFDGSGTLVDIDVLGSCCMDSATRDVEYGTTDGCIIVFAFVLFEFFFCRTKRSVMGHTHPVKEIGVGSLFKHNISPVASHKHSGRVYFGGDAEGAEYFVATEYILPFLNVVPCFWLKCS